MADCSSVAMLKAVVDAINAGDFSEEITAFRSHLAEFSAKDLDDVKVTAAIYSSSTDHLTRGLYLDRVEIDVGIQQRIDDVDPTERVEELLGLAQEIIDLFLRTTITINSRRAECVSLESIPAAPGGSVVAHLRESRVFTGVVRLGWEIERAAG